MTQADSPPPQATIGAATQVSRNALLSEIEKLADPPAPKPVAPKPEPDAKPVIEAKTEPEPKDPLPEEPEVKAEAKPDEETIDPETQKGIDRIRREEKRFKESLAAERQKFKDETAEREREYARREAKLAPRLQALEEFEALTARAKYDPGAILEKLGLSEDDMEPAAKAIYARSKAAKADPKNRAQVEADARVRESADRIAKLEAKLAEREKADAERERATQNQALLTRYLDTVSKAVDDETPLARAWISKNPEAARRAFHQVAVEISDGDNPPDPREVVQAWEKKRREELEDLGIDWRASAKTSNGPGKPAKTLSGAVGGSTTAPNGKRSIKEVDADIRRALLEDRLE